MFSVLPYLNEALKFLFFLRGAYMLKLRLKVANVSEDVDHHVIVSTYIESSDEPTEMRIPIVQEEPERIGNQIAGQLQKVLVASGMVPPNRRPIQTSVSFYLTEQMFFSMGRPTVGDYIQVGTVKLHR